MKQIVLSILFFAMIFSIKAQTGIKVSGIVFDASNGEPVIGATVQMQNVKDSLQSKYAITNVSGVFEVKQLDKAFYRLKITSLGYTLHTRLIRVGEIDMDLGKITLTPDTKMLEAIEVKGAVVAVELKGDTIQYNADAYKVNPDASTKDLVSKMPGIVVSSTGVTANGESVGQVLLDGKRFFGQDPLLSLNTIPAQVVQRVEVFDQKSQQSQFTGFDDGNTTKTMNVVTKQDKRNGQFGNVYGGMGTDNRYKAGANINSFKNDRRLTVLGMTNSINQQNFSSEDLASIGGGRRGGNNLTTGSQSGITKTNSLGMNLSDKWGKKVTMEGSYFFNQNENGNNSFRDRTTFLKGGSQLYNESTSASTDNLGHRLNVRLTYDINKNNKIMLIPSVSYQDNQSLKYTQGVTSDAAKFELGRTENDYNSGSKNLRINNNLIYQHKFEKIGRTISLDVNTMMVSNDQKNAYTDFTQDSLTQYLTDEKQREIGSNITYTEPVGTTGQLSASYAINYAGRDSDKRTYIQDKTTDQANFSTPLSNTFESGYTTQKSSFFFSNRSFDKFFNIGVTYQYASLNNDQLYPVEGTFGKSFNSILPSVMGRFELKGGTNMFVRYSTNTNEPSIDQLQNVINNSNPFFLTVGNPNLNQSYSHSLFMRTNKSNTDKNTSFSNFVRVETTSNYITNGTILVFSDSLLAQGVTARRGAQISTPVNLNGYWNVSNNSTYSILISKIKSNLNTSVGLTYRRLPGLTNNLQNMANTYSGNLQWSLVSNFSKDIDFNVYYSVNGNKVINSIRSSANTQYVTQTFGGKFNFIFGKGFIFRNDISHLKYTGVSSTFNTSYTLWNMSFAKKFMKNNAAELELSVFDLLHQNQSVSQNVTSNYIEESRTQVLQQYFMLTFTYQIRRFAGGE